MRHSLRSPSRSAAGFTLIELMIAMAVLTLGLLALWSLHTASIQASARSYRLGICTMLAQDSMEKMMAETFIANDPNGVNPDLAPMGVFPAADADGLDDLAGFIDGVGVRVNSLGNTVVTIGPTLYLRSYHVENLGAEADRVLLRTRVTYIDDGGNRHGVTLAATRLVDRYDPAGQGVLSI